MRIKNIIIVVLILTINSQVLADTRYVDITNPTPTAPYTSWSTAANTIQEAVDASVNGETVQVADGHYLLTSEIVVNKGITIQSANGPESTIVDGQGIVRCFNLGNTNCILGGLTITNGNFSGGYGGGISCSGTTPIVTNCTIVGNSAYGGGGMYYGTANNCTFSGNSSVSSSGGGMYYGIANNCTISGNSAWSKGGGIGGGVANNCTISGNSAYGGGGIYNGTANNCTISNNSADYDGGGMYNGTANNCTISGNSAGHDGGGIYYGTVNNCTISGNNTLSRGGGMKGGTANNCIVWYNQALLSDQDLSYTTARYVCSPDVTQGVEGNITNAPLMVSASHVAANSPCRGTGSSAYVSGTDVDGEAWLDPPSIGCDEYHGSVTGSLQVSIVCATNAANAYPVSIRGTIEGAVATHVWNFDDGTVVTNSLYPSHSWSSPGTYSLTLTAFNDTYPDGVSATQTIHIATLADLAVYVSQDGNDFNDGSSWTMAKATLQASINAQNITGGLVWVSNGTYAVTSEITIAKNILIQSLNGPESVVVDGQGITRCFNLGNVACILSGLTITNGYTSGNGGGIYCTGTTPIVTNCMINGNSAYGGGGMNRGTASHCIINGNSADHGGGISGGTAHNCVISGNSTVNNGGGMDGGLAHNCTISGNSSGYNGGGMFGGAANNCNIIGNNAAYHGGGMLSSTANNCIVWYNQALDGTNLYSATARYTCSPDVTHGIDGNITNAPLLVSASHVAPNSACRGAGSSVYASGTDIDEETWLDPPSMGCDEYHGSVTGPLQVDLECSSTNVVNAYPVSLLGIIEGAVTAHVWSFGDGIFATNSLYSSHAWSSPGTYALSLTAYNDTYPAGVSTTQTVVVLSRDASAIYITKDGDDSNNGTSWTMAKATLQAGINAQNITGGLVWVSNGTYAVTSEITVAKNILIQSLNGPEAVIVDGQGVTRCFNLGNAACILSGLTITNGSTSGDGGGIYCTGTKPVVTNCTISGNTADYGGGISYGTANHCTINDNSAGYYGGGMSYGTANHCTISGNSVNFSGGGMYRGTANHCMVSNNAGLDGGGIYYASANHCVISGNSASRNGGGMCDGTANHCTISSNSASSGGGMYGVTANHCTISGNSAGVGGGMREGEANHCTISSNIATISGGGIYYGTVNNCTISSNNASSSGGGMQGGTANNCIVWYNQAPAGQNLYSTTVRYTCSPTAIHGADGNITNAPMFFGSGNYRLATISPCINAGHNDYAPAGTDLDGNPRMAGGVVDMGAYERQDAEMDVDGDGMEDWWEMMYLVGRHFAVPDATCSNAINSVLEAYIAGLDPTNSASTFTSTNVHPDASGFIIEWAPSMSDRLYTVNWSTNLTNDFQPQETGIEFPQNSFTDTVHTAEKQCFYQVEVQLK